MAVKYKYHVSGLVIGGGVGLGLVLSMGELTPGIGVGAALVVVITWLGRKPVEPAGAEDAVGEQSEQE